MSIRKQPFNDSKIVKTIPKGTTVFVISKTETNDWYLIKEIMVDWAGDDIGEILGYSSADYFLSVDKITSGNGNKNAKVYIYYRDFQGNIDLDTLCLSLEYKF